MIHSNTDRKWESAKRPLYHWG